MTSDNQHATAHQNTSADADAIPSMALLLGIAGLIPFFGSAAVTWVASPAGSEMAVYALLTYGAVILSFLGGVRWGACLQDPKALQRISPLTLSILPSLVAWLALLMTPGLGLLLLIIGLALQYVIDRIASARDQLPHWYGRLRTLLSAGAIALLLIGFLGAAKRGLLIV